MEEKQKNTKMIAKTMLARKPIIPPKQKCFVRIVENLAEEIQNSVEEIGIKASDKQQTLQQQRLMLSYLNIYI